MLVIDPKRQMLIMEAEAEKSWCGVMQDLPVPSLGQSIAYQIYARFMLGTNAPIPPLMDWGPYLGGLVMGVDLRANPGSSEFWTAHYHAASDGTLVEGIIETAHFDDYAFPYAADIRAPACSFVRANVVSEQTAPGVYETSLFFAISPTGEAYTTIFGYELAVPLRQFAFAQRSEGEGSFSTFFDFVRYHLVLAGDDLTGARQQLGSV